MKLLRISILLLVMALGGLPSVVAGGENEDLRMNESTEPIISELRTACRSNDLDAIEKVVRRLTEQADSQDTQLLLVACDVVSIAPIADQRRIRPLVRDIAETALKRSMEADPAIKVQLLTRYLRVDRSTAHDQNDWQNLRKKSAILWLGVWKDVEKGIDPNWRQDDPANYVLPYQPPPGVLAPPSGTAPDSIKDPKIREPYQAHIDTNRKRSERNYRQNSLRRLKSEYAGEIKNYIIGLYSESPLDLNELKSVLAGVFDKNNEKEILDAVKGPVL